MYLAIILNGEGRICSAQTFARKEASEAWLDSKSQKSTCDFYGRIFNIADVVEMTSKFKAVAL